MVHETSNNLPKKKRRIYLKTAKAFKMSLIIRNSVKRSCFPLSAAVSFFRFFLQHFKEYERNGENGKLLENREACVVDFLESRKQQYRSIAKHKLLEY